jgi:hypothetical protein
VDDEAIAALNSCEHLFLSEIEELDYNGLRLVVREGRVAGKHRALQVGETVISDCTPIGITLESAAFELVWRKYVAYSILNESFAAPDDADRFEGSRFRLYSKSAFIDYVSRASFACAEYPGPTQHYEVVCENHIVDVIAAIGPVVQRLSSISNYFR